MNHINENWFTEKINNLPLVLVDSDRSKRYPKRSEFKKTGVIFLNAESITGGRINLSKINHITLDKFQEITKGRIQDNDLIITMRGNGVGDVALVSGDFGKGLINAQMLIIRPKDNSIDSKYLYYWFINPRFQLELMNFVTGSAQPQLTMTHLRHVPISLAPIVEQKAIAHILGSLDDKIELNRQMNQTLESMAQALFKSWFVDFDPVIDNALAAGNEIPDVFAKRAEARAELCKSGGVSAEFMELFPSEFEYTEEIGWIPKGWGVSESGALFDVKDGTHDSPKQAEEGKYLITSRHITGGIIDFSNAYLISLKDYEDVNRRSKVDSYDVLLTMIGTVGIPLIVLEENIDFAIKNIGLFKTGLEKKYAIFFYLYLKSTYMSQFLESRLAGTTQKYLTLKVLRSLPVITSSDDVLKYFEENVSSIFLKIRANNKQISELTKLRDTLLPKLLSGELRIPDAEKLISDTEV